MLRVALLQVASPAAETVAARRDRVGQMVAAAKGAWVRDLPGALPRLIIPSQARGGIAVAPYSLQELQEAFDNPRLEILEGAEGCRIRLGA